MDWNTYFILEAVVAALKSKDKRTQVGACIVGPDGEIRSKGYNGPVRGERDDDPGIYEKPLKALLFEHAERNAIFNLARIGVSGKDCRMYVTLHPCADCARAIHQTGIKELIIPGSPDAFVFSESQHQGALLLQRVGLPVRWWQGELPKLEILHDGSPQKIGFR